MAKSQVQSGGVRPRAVITGAAKRVGRAIATELARAGCDIVITYNTSAAEANEAAAEFARLGAVASAEALDLDDLDTVERFGERLAAVDAPIDVLVHNASTYEGSPLTELTAERALRDYRVNALAPVLLTKHLAPRLAESRLPGGGAVVAMCDIHAMGEHGIPRNRFSSYAMSKAALSEMVRSLAKELAPKVRVNGIAPGVVKWPEEGYEADEAAQNAYLKRVPLARSGTPEDAANAVRWLALEAAYITGQIVRVDGGRSLI